jgi:hypothetical protein
LTLRTLYIDLPSQSPPPKMLSTRTEALVGQPSNML